MLLRQYFDCKNSPISNENPRILIIGGPDLNSFSSNKISTAKYSFVNFVPKFLFEQSLHYSNIFFLCIGLLQQIPGVSPTGRFVTIVPFGIILGLHFYFATHFFQSFDFSKLGSGHLWDCYH